MQSIRMLVTGGGGPAAVSFINALSGTGAELFVADIDPYAAGLYLVPLSHRVLVPRGDDPLLADVLLTICRHHRIDLLVPTVDAELLPLVRNAERFRKAGVRLLLASESALETCLDKWRLVSACADVVIVPRSAPLDHAFSPEGWTAPVIVKPRRGSGSRGVRLVRSWSELNTLPQTGELLVQEYLPGEEYSVDVLADPVDGSVVAAVPRVRLKVDSGVAVTSRTVHDSVLEKSAKAVASRVGLTFVGNVQFKRNRMGEPALLEVNPRFPGTMPLTVASGINMPRLAVEAAFGNRLSGRTFTFDELAVVRTWQDHFFSPSELLIGSLEREAA